MNKLTTKINFLYFITLMLLLASLILGWKLFFIPFVKNSEQVKADLLLAPYGPMFEKMIDEQQYDDVDELIANLLLLKDESSDQPLLLKLDLVLENGKLISQENESRDSEFVNEIVLFSPSDFSLLGSLKIVYNDHSYQKLLAGSRDAIDISIAVVLTLFLLGYFLLKHIVSPLTQLSDYLRDAESLDKSHMPELNHGLSDEIKNVWHATEVLLDRIKSREDALKEEHEIAQAAMQDKLDAESANESKSRFLANMSHEIRTPLTAIIGFADSLRHDAMSTEKRENATLTIIRNGKHLLGVINDILDLSKIESEKLDIERLDVVLLQVISEVESVFRPQFTEKSLSFELDYKFPLPQKILTDPTRLRQILFNLLSNAKKFTESGTVKLTVSYDAPENAVDISVKDDGIGLTTAQLDRVFKPFSQADASTTRKYGGTGLGLTISRTLAKMLGGDLQVKSIEGEGATFNLRIDVGHVTAIYNDISEHHASAPQEEESVLLGILKGRILVAEDTPDIQELIGFYLEHTELEITFANDGQAAVDLALANGYDVILMDMQMPVLDGLSATKTLRSSGYRSPIVALTANAMSEDQALYKISGLDAFIAKPIDKQELYRVIGQFLTPIENANGLKNSNKLSAKKGDVDKAEKKRKTKEKLAKRFRENLPNWLDDISKAIETDDNEKLLRASHVLKGLGGSFGFPEITEICADIEKSAKENNLKLAHELFIQLHEFCLDKVL